MRRRPQEERQRERRPRERRLPAGIFLAVVLFVFALAATTTGSDPKPQSEPGLLPVDVGTPQRIDVFPREIHLTGTRERAQLVVTGIYGDAESVQDLTRVSALRSLDETIATVTDGVVFPVADGRTEIEVSVGGHTARVPVIASGQRLHLSLIHI